MDQVVMVSRGGGGQWAGRVSVRDDGWNGEAGMSKGCVAGTGERQLGSVGGAEVGRRQLASQRGCGGR